MPQRVTSSGKSALPERNHVVPRNAEKKYCEFQNFNFCKQLNLDMKVESTKLTFFYRIMTGKKEIFLKSEVYLQKLLQKG